MEHMCCDQGLARFPIPVEDAPEQPRLPVAAPAEAYGARPADSVFCPEGSAAPVEVGDGYYATGGDECKRVSQALCDRSNDQFGRCSATTISA